MAATVNDNAPPAAALSPRSSSGEGIRRRNPSPSWNQVVLGPEAEVSVDPPAPSVTAAVAVVEEENSVQGKIESLTEGFESETQQEGSDNGNGNGSKKLAWSKPSNGGPEIGPVMGAVTWPSLSESTKASPKPPAADLSKNPSDAPVSVPQVTTSTAALPSPVSSSSAPQRQMTNNPNNPNPSATTQHHGRPSRPKSLKREGGGSSSSNGGFSHQPPPQSSLAGEASHDSNSSVKPALGGSDSSGRDHHGHNNAYREGGQRGGGGDHPQHRNYRRNNSGPHLRGDGSFGNRRDQDRANHDWNHNRSFNGRDNAVPPQRAGPRGGGFFRPPPGAAPYIPPPIGPYTNPMSMPPEMQPLYYLAPHPGMPFVAQMPPAFFSPPFDPQLHAKILNQIDYYFSNENLIRDTFLRRNMDEHGWVPVQLIASFNKVTQLTTNVQLILDVVRASALVEVQGDKIRKRDDWMRWIMPPSVQYPTASSSQSPRTSGQDTLAAHMQGLAVDEKTVNKSNSSGQLDIHAGTLLRSSSGEVNLHPETSKGGSTQMGVDHAVCIPLPKET